MLRVVFYIRKSMFLLPMNYYPTMLTKNVQYVFGYLGEMVEWLHVARDDG